MESIARRDLLGAAGIAGVAVLASFAKGGPLDPPTGPVSPTMKTLDDVEPRTLVGTSGSTIVISQPGSYYLTGNLQAPVNAAVIQIAAGGVTLDLNGFTVSGNPASTTPADAISIAPGLSSVTCRNGTIRDIPTGAAIYGPSSATMIVLEDLRVLGASGFGLIAGNASRVERCVVTNSGGGILVDGLTATVRNCNIVDVTSTGIQLETGVVESCTVENAFTAGVRTVGEGVLLDRCCIRRCGYGAQFTAYGVISNSVFRRNGIGIDANYVLIRGNFMDNETNNITGTGNLTVDNLLH